MKRFAALAVLCTLAGCFTPAVREPERFFILEAPAATGAGLQSVPESTLRVAPTTAASFYDTQDMVYSRTPGTRAYYQYNRWTEAPSRQINAALAARLGAMPAKPGLTLRTHLEEIYHDAAESPGIARIVLTAELVDPAQRMPVAKRTFSQSAPAASYDAAGAVKGFSQALGALLAEVAAWVERAAPAGITSPAR
jgi:cholesterol transport system auxiliary component